MLTLNRLSKIGTASRRLRTLLLLFSVIALAIGVVAPLEGGEDAIAKEAELSLIHI